MFNTNKIPVTEEELIKLFFKDKPIPKGEEPYLDFYQFLQFALSKESDQDFRNFMRQLKVKTLELNREQAKLDEYDNKQQYNA